MESQAQLNEKYIIQSKMALSTKEADLYICSDGNDHYIAKIYKRKAAIEEKVIEKWKKIDSPYIAKIYDIGEADGCPYEILPYYKNGSLKGKRFSYNRLKAEIIPALNEGLKVLHDNGIIHKNLEPSSIMLADNGQDVVITDFGSNLIREDENTVTLTRTDGMLKDLAPETFKNLFLNKSDYYSFGITIYELYCGYMPYAHINQNEIESLLSVQKMSFPADMKDELKVLIRALTSSLNRRWGYEEVRKWCVGLKQSIPDEVTGLTELVMALANHWEDGKEQLFKGEISAYFKEFNTEIARVCMDAEQEVLSGEEDRIFFKTLYKIDSTMTKFLWKGKQYKDIFALGNEFLEVLWANSTSMNSFIDELLQKSVLSQYILCIDRTDTERANKIKEIESSYQAFKNDKRQRTINYYLLAYILSGKKVFYKNGIQFKSIQELTNFLKSALEDSYDKFEKLCYNLLDYNGTLDIQFESWLLALGKKNEIEQWRKSLQGKGEYKKWEEI